MINSLWLYLFSTILLSLVEITMCDPKLWTSLFLTLIISQQLISVIGQNSKAIFPVCRSVGVFYTRGTIIEMFKRRLFALITRRFLLFFFFLSQPENQLLSENVVRTFFQFSWIDFSYLCYTPYLFRFIFAKIIERRIYIPWQIDVSHFSNFLTFRFFICSRA